jgi:hypothetical protein
MSEVKKVTVSLDGIVIGTRRNTRAYTHAIVDSEKKEVVSYHLTPGAAMENAGRRRLRGQSYLVVLPTEIVCHWHPHPNRRQSGADSQEASMKVHDFVTRIEKIGLVAELNRAEYEALSLALDIWRICNWRVKWHR